MINQEKQSFSLSDNAMTCNVETSVYKLFLIQEFPSNKIKKRFCVNRSRSSGDGQWLKLPHGAYLAQL